MHLDSDPMRHRSSSGLDTRQPPSLGSWNIVAVAPHPSRRQSKSCRTARRDATAPAAAVGVPCTSGAASPRPTPSAHAVAAALARAAQSQRAGPLCRPAGQRLFACTHEKRFLRPHQDSSPTVSYLGMQLALPSTTQGREMWKRSATPRLPTMRPSTGRAPENQFAVVLAAALSDTVELGLLQSFAHAWRETLDVTDLSLFAVIAPCAWTQEQANRDLVQRRILGWLGTKFELHCDDEVLCGSPGCAGLSNNRKNVRGWVMQQIVKLAAVRIIRGASAYLVVDADTLPLRPVNALALMRPRGSERASASILSCYAGDSEGFYDRHMEGMQQRWMRSSERLLTSAGVTRAQLAAAPLDMTAASTRACPMLGVTPQMLQVCDLPPSPSVLPMRIHASGTCDLPPPLSVLPMCMHLASLRRCCRWTARGRQP